MRLIPNACDTYYKILPIQDLGRIDQSLTIYLASGKYLKKKKWECNRPIYELFVDFIL